MEGNNESILTLLKNALFFHFIIIKLSSAEMSLLIISFPVSVRVYLAQKRKKIKKCNQIKVPLFA